MEDLKLEIQKTFIEKFNSEPIIIASPGRINIIGEHTDYNSGHVLPTAINKYIIVAINRSENKLSTVFSLDFNNSFQFDVKEDINPEKGSWESYIYGVVQELKKKEKTIENFNLVFGGNIPMGAGLSSSAALENGVIFGLNELFSLGLSMMEMVDISINAEHNYAGVDCGIMDQFSSMMSEENNVIYLNCATLSFEKINLDLGEVELILLNTNVKHQLTNSPYNERKKQCEEGLQKIKIKHSHLNGLCEANSAQLLEIKTKISNTVFNRCNFVIQENERVKKAVTAIKNKNWKTLGKLLFESHMGLKNEYEVSCSELDFLIEKAIGHNAVIGGRMMGGGFGGCTINLVPKGKYQEYVNFIKPLYEKKFNKELSIYPVKSSRGTFRI